MKYEIIAECDRAKSAHFETVHGSCETPVFMNVATRAAIRGAISALDLEEINTQIMLCNTYHLHVRPGEQVVKHFGGLNGFTKWRGITLTDSGGFQVYSLAKLRGKIKEEGVSFNSHVNGAHIFIGPEESMDIQSSLASTIAMAFDECAPALADRNYIHNSVDRTTRWLERCIKRMEYNNSKEDTLNKEQLLFGINQGGIIPDIRIEHAKKISEYDLPGYSVGGLAVGESHEQMYEILDCTVPYLPRKKPSYLMGVGTPINILEGIDRGIDFFDCVYPTRNGRHGHCYTEFGRLNLLNKQYEFDEKPIEETCGCPACQHFTRGYIRHLLKSEEMLGLRLCSLHNLYFYNHLMEKSREAIRGGYWKSFKEESIYKLNSQNEIR